MQRQPKRNPIQSGREMMWFCQFSWPLWFVWYGFILPDEKDALGMGEYYSLMQVVLYRYRDFLRDNCHLAAWINACSNIIGEFLLYRIQASDNVEAKKMILLR